MSDTLIREREGAVAVLVLNRPDKLNALNQELISALLAAVQELDADEGVRACVLTGAGDRAFAAGADIAAMAEMSTTDARLFSELGHRAGAAMEAAHFPIVGAVNGFALGGGCELAMACDFLYACEKAKFGQPEVSLAVIPGFGGTQRLARRVGIGRAREICYTGEVIGAEEALRVGLVNRVVSAAELLGAAKATAQKIASMGPRAVASCKRVMLRGEDVPLTVAHELEMQAFGGLFGTADQREGMRAFLEKRKASFVGR